MKTSRTMTEQEVDNITMCNRINPNIVPGFERLSIDVFKLKRELSILPDCEDTIDEAIVWHVTELLKNREAYRIWLKTA